MKIALLIQYDGTQYRGWQVQKDPDTVQGLLEQALQRLFDQKLGLTGSGRTDSGVHALGQVAHFEIETCTIPVHNVGKALNRFLPDDIKVLASEKVSEEFHSRFAAIRRQYVYQIQTQKNVLNRSSQWFVRFALDESRLVELAGIIEGEHDFSSFCYAGTETENMVCNILSAKWEKYDGDVLKFSIAGNRFLHHMVRMLVGSMVEVARGKWSVEHFTELLNQPDRKAHTVTAPAQGLALVQVNYPDRIQPSWNIAEG